MKRLRAHLKDTARTLLRNILASAIGDKRLFQTEMPQITAIARIIDASNGTNLHIPIYAHDGVYTSDQAGTLEDMIALLRATGSYSTAYAITRTEPKFRNAGTERGRRAGAVMARVPGTHARVYVAVLCLDVDEAHDLAASIAPKLVREYKKFLDDQGNTGTTDGTVPEATTSSAGAANAEKIHEYLESEGFTPGMGRLERHDREPTLVGGGSRGDHGGPG